MKHNCSLPRLSYWMMFPLFFLLMVQCRKSSSEQPAFDSEKAAEHVITLKTAHRFKNTFANRMQQLRNLLAQSGQQPDDLLRFTESVLIKRETFDLLQQTPGCTGIGIYSARENDGTVTYLLNAIDDADMDMPNTTYGAAGKLSDEAAATLIKEFGLHLRKLEKRVATTGIELDILMDLPRGQAFNRDAIQALLQVPLLSAVRIYHGIKKNGKGCVVLVPVAADGRNIQAYLLQQPPQSYSGGGTDQEFPIPGDSTNGEALDRGRNRRP